MAPPAPEPSTLLLTFGAVCYGMPAAVGKSAASVTRVELDTKVD
jgi:hypothetical protein